MLATGAAATARERSRLTATEFQHLGARRRARFRASIISAFTRVFRRAMRAHFYRVAALAARFARQRGARSGVFAAMGDGLRKELRVRQFAALGHGISGDEVRVVGRLEMRQRVERQAEADRRIAGHQEYPAPPRLPDFADPPRGRLRGPALHRQHVARRRSQVALERAHDAVALDGIVDLGIAGIDILRQLALLEHALGRILEGRLHIFRLDAEPRSDRLREPMRIVGDDPLAGGLRGDQRRVAPDRLAVAAPIQGEGPARQRLARIPFALTVMQEPARREPIAQAADQSVGADALGGPKRGDVPLRRLRSRRSTRTSARRPWSVAHRARARSASTFSPSASSAAQASSLNG